MKIFFICFLLTVMVFINRKSIAAGIRQWLTSKRNHPPVFYQSPDALRSIYERYERILKERYGATRGRCETDREVLERLGHQPDFDTHSLVHIKEFIEEFHKVRFGNTPPRDLEKILQKTQNSIK